jgi:hypothetical protein
VVKVAIAIAIAIAIAFSSPDLLTATFNTRGVNHPVQIGLLRLEAIVHAPNPLAHQIE